jgi:hypothetical protein
MPVARYFLYVGGVLIALLFAVAALVPPEAAIHSAPGIDRSTVRIHSDQKLPERVVFDTTLPPVVPAAAKVQTAAAPVPAPDMSAQTRVRDTFAQFIPGDPRKAEQGVVKAEQTVAKVEPVAPPKKRKIARVHSAPPAAYPPYGSPMRVAQQQQQQQQRFGFFGGPIWNNTW